MAIFEQFGVWLVPFPFTDQRATKRRPAVVLSSHSTFNLPSGHCIMAMITSSAHAPWPLDLPLTDLRGAGLNAPSIVRMKVFTLDQRLVIRQLGKLGNKDQKALEQQLSRLFNQ